MASKITEKIVQILNDKNRNNFELYKNQGYKNLLKIYLQAIANEIKDEKILELNLNNFNRVEYKSFDNKNIVGIYHLNPKKTKKWIISIHGYSSSKEASAVGAYYFNSLGYNIFSFDFRNHGESDDAQITLGINEQKDLEATLNYLKENFNPKEIAFIGFSMGAHTLNRLALDINPKKYKISFGISDSSYFETEKVLKKIINTIGGPLVGNFLDGLVEDVIEVYNQNHNIDVKGNTPKYMLPLCKESFPILFIHSKEDKITDYVDSEKLYSLRKILNEKDVIHIFQTGEHIRTQISHNKMYWKLVEDFIKKVK
ncbi:alpha/beta hydrolase [Spiroplasma taiwanense]|uniref:AB hydrolase-1 domain-containing protein n=1 Tax=Spiroplasma taiwanense CT-1 TaxID=1276220 RepID=S5MHT8_9MOLU|nr:alpha/beta fold hydrolase [Spiroplasma taiwanense]AGR41450.1 hypothetical protein STAIW_v1c08640 [Spiroplasma taiwanense CT-1]